MDWQSVSEIVTGLVLDNRLALNAVNQNQLIQPYNEIIKLLKDGKGMDHLIEEVGLDPVQSSLDAAHRLNGTATSANWLKLLEKSKHNTNAGNLLEKMSRKLQQGEAVDWSKISSLASQAMEGVGTGLVPLDEVMAMEIPFKITGFKSIDEHLGGIPAIGELLIGATPGTGKTTFMLQLAGCWVKTHPTEQVVIFTLEMLKEELKLRLSEVIDLTEDELKRILVEDSPLTAEDTVSIAASVQNRGMVMIDFADLLIEGETTESTMAHIYRTYMKGAKALRCPFVVLAQLNGSYDGGIPRPFHVRYTRLAEALAWAMYMLYNPNRNWYAEDGDDEILPPVSNKAYIIAWKQRGGFRIHKEDSPGAIQLPYKGELGWHYNHPGKWFSLAKEGSIPEKKHSKR